MKCAPIFDPILRLREHDRHTIFLLFCNSHVRQKHFAFSLATWICWLTRYFIRKQKHKTQRGMPKWLKRLKKRKMENKKIKKKYTQKLIDSDGILKTRFDLHFNTTNTMLHSTFVTCSQNRPKFSMRRSN